MSQLKLKGATSGDVTLKCADVAGTNTATFPATTGNVVTTGDSLTVSQGMIADQAINEAKLQVSNPPTNGFFLSAQSGNTGGLTWAAAPTPDATKIEVNDTKVFCTDTGSNGTVKINTDGTTRVTVANDGFVTIPGNMSIAEMHVGHGNASAANSNTVVGNVAGENISSTGIRNVCVGLEAGRGITSGSNNTMIGFRAGQNGTLSGENNVGIGNEALQDCAAGSGNVAIGREAGQNLTTGDFNTLVGQWAGQSGQITGDWNVCVGFGTGASMGAAASNVYIGRNAGGNALNGQVNTCVGADAGLGITSGGGNTLIGFQAGRSASPSGNISTQTFQVVLGNNSVTDLWCADTSISSSDQRDKADITDFTHGLDWITQMRPVTYKWDKRSWYVDWDANPDTLLSEVTSDGTHKKDRVNIGLLAQEVQTIEKADGFSTSSDNELICKTTSDGQQIGLKYERIVPVLINAIKELKAEVDTLKAKVAALEAG